MAQLVARNTLIRTSFSKEMLLYSKKASRRNTSSFHILSIWHLDVQIGKVKSQQIKHFPSLFNCPLTWEILPEIHKVFLENPSQFTRPHEHRSASVKMYKEKKITRMRNASAVQENQSEEWEITILWNDVSAR